MRFQLGRPPAIVVEQTRDVGRQWVAHHRDDLDPAALISPPFQFLVEPSSAREAVAPFARQVRPLPRSLQRQRLGESDAFIAEKVGLEEAHRPLDPLRFQRSGHRRRADLAHRVDDQQRLVAIHASSVAPGTITIFADDGDDEPLAEGAQFARLFAATAFLLARSNGQGGRCCHGRLQIRRCAAQE